MLLSDVLIMAQKEHYVNATSYLGFELPSRAEAGQYPLLRTARLESPPSQWRDMLTQTRFLCGDVDKNKEQVVSKQALGSFWQTMEQETSS